MGSLFEVIPRTDENATREALGSRRGAMRSLANYGDEKAIAQRFRDRAMPRISHLS
jgi:hypothetical protein